MFTYELARRLEGTGVTATALHPGMTSTAFGAEDTARGWGPLIAVMRPFMTQPRTRRRHLGLPGELARGRGRHRPVLRRPQGQGRRTRPRTTRRRPPGCGRSAPISSASRSRRAADRGVPCPGGGVATARGGDRTGASHRPAGWSRAPGLARAGRPSLAQAIARAPLHDRRRAAGRRRCPRPEGHPHAVGRSP